VVTLVRAVLVYSLGRLHPAALAGLFWSTTARWTRRLLEVLANVPAVASGPRVRRRDARGDAFQTEARRLLHRRRPYRTNENSRSGIGMAHVSDANRFTPTP
jgi:hypothetical protein